MGKCKTYIYAAVKNALEQNIENVPGEVLQPLVAPQSAPVFPEDVMRRISFYNDMALNVEDFESWMNLLEHVANETGLSVATDLEKIASVLNRFRMENGKEPL